MLIVRLSVRNKMNILYDGWIFGLQAAGGINRYFARIISNLPEEFTPVFTANNLGKIDRPSHPNLSVFKCQAFRPRRISSRIEEPFFRFVAGRKYDVAHPTYYTLLTGRELSDYRCPVVLTVHDMIHELFAAQMDSTGEEAAIKRRAIMAATAIICVSENTKYDLLNIYPAVEEKVFVIHNAHGIDANMSHGAETTPQPPYFIYVGSREVGYKNFARLLHAFGDVVSRFDDATLCVVGAPFKDAEHKLINELKLTGSVQNYGHVSDAHLAKLYRRSVALVYPSLYEGFGIPPLEAMACETAVIASNSSSIPEVVGDAGLLIEPSSVDAMTDAMLLMLNDSAKRECLIEAGRRRIENFSWEKTARQTVEVYQTVGR